MQSTNKTILSHGRLSLDELLNALHHDNTISADVYEHVLQYRFISGMTKTHPILWLAERELETTNGQALNTEYLLRWLANIADLPYFVIDPLKIQVGQIVEKLSSSYTARYRILPIAVSDSSITFATAEPFERDWEDEMAHVLRKQVKRVIANPSDIARYQEELFGVSHSIHKATQQAEADPLGINNLEALVKLGRAGKLDANDRHVVTIVDWLLQYAFEQRASDIHIEPRRDVGNIRFRIDGVMHTVYQIPALIVSAVTARIKALGRMDVVEKRRPQDGRVKTKTPSEQEIELRLSTMPTAFGEKLVMRIFDPQVLVRDFSELGFSKNDTAIWDELTAKSHGIILVTGPTGSGKTTTLYSTLNALASADVNVCTVEDPIEMVSEELNQMQVNHTIGLDFAVGIRTLMRQDPDIIMVGEIRDLETAEMAIQAALTGHLVLSTLHTNDAPSAVVRLMDIGVPPYLIKATLLGVLGQRLVRTLCPHCKQKTAVDTQEWADITWPWTQPAPKAIYKADGCEQCRNTGYQGRIGIYESLKMTSKFKNSINADTDIAELRKIAITEGMETLSMSGARKVAAGTTNLSEILRVAPNERYE